MSDVLEFYRSDSQSPFCAIGSSFQPNDGDLVNIKKITYKVIGRSFTIDHYGQHSALARCNVIVEEHK